MGDRYAPGLAEPRAGASLTRRFRSVASRHAPGVAGDVVRAPDVHQLPGAQGVIEPRLRATHHRHRDPRLEEERGHLVVAGPVEEHGQVVEDQGGVEHDADAAEQTIAIAVRHDNAERVAGFAASRALPFQVAFDVSGELAKDFGNVRITPTSFLIDRRGRVIWRAVGEPNWSELHQRVERALGDAGS